MIMVDDTKDTSSGAHPSQENMYTIAEEYSRWKKEQNGAEQGWREQMRASFEAMMKQAEAGELVSKPATMGREERAVAETMAGERREVVEEVVLQHKQSLLGEWESAGEVWNTQAETWSGGCAICRIRNGERLKHNWRHCPFHKRERKSVTAAHSEVERGVLSIENCVQFEGVCPGCGLGRETCWMQVMQETDEGGCRYAGVVTESAAAIMAIGPAMVGEWERREGRRRGAGIEGIESFTQQRFGGVEAGRLWRTFGWVGVWDIREARVDQVCTGWEKRLVGLTGGEEWPGARYRVRQGQIGAHAVV